MATIVKHTRASAEGAVGITLEILLHIYVASEWVLRIVMALVVPRRRSPQSASAWLLLIMFLPWVGLVLYLLIGRPRSKRERFARMRDVPRRLAPILDRVRHSPGIFEPEVPPALKPAVLLAHNLTQFPVMGGNRAEILCDYMDTLRRLTADIESAQDHVHLLFYIIADDAATDPLWTALEQARARGVTCRVLFDAFGSGHFSAKILKRLAVAQIEVHAMLPVNFWRKPFTRFDLRNHRKIAVIDGRIGYTGSQNLIDPKFKPGIEYEDLMLRLTGPIVLALQIVFIIDWYLETNVLLESEALFPSPEVTGTLPIQLLPSGPDFPDSNNQQVIVSLVHGARKRIVITTPYLIPDEPLLQALRSAVMRGVEVHIVVSAKLDQFLVGQAQESYYDDLLDVGVLIHRYQKAFLHSKHLSFDDDLAMIGTSNIDIRSFLLNAEVMLLVYDQGLVAQLRAEQERYFAHSERLHAAQWRKRSRIKQAVLNVARLFSPLL